MSVRVIEPGWLYILTNPAMPDLCKIGMTTRTPEERAAELHDTGSPAPYTVAKAWPVDDVRAAERDAHAALARYRVSDQREWFRVSVPKAIKALGMDRPTPARPSWLRRLWRVCRGLVEGVGWLTLLLLAAG
ncbi:GIY-YIG nuclease family protein [Alterinioella nitratireducens]|uniref:GIY-YIG nuclease family protein n=1 Tax=Alterinioella nitratireducens TaxID=2735915 RepID=UPI00405A2D46